MPPPIQLVFVVGAPPPRTGLIPGAYSLTPGTYGKLGGMIISPVAFNPTSNDGKLSLNRAYTPHLILPSASSVSMRLESRGRRFPTKTKIAYIQFGNARVNLRLSHAFFAPQPQPPTGAL